MNEAEPVIGDDTGDFLRQGACSLRDAAVQSWEFGVEIFVKGVAPEINSSQGLKSDDLSLFVSTGHPDRLTSKLTHIVLIEVF